MKSTGQIPYCSLGLIAAAFCCHVTVYFGNMYAAASISALGSSSNGWSEIGLSLGRSIGGELDRQLGEVGEDLTSVVSAIVEMKGMVGGALPLASLARRDPDLSADDADTQSFDETVLVSAFLVEKVADLVRALKPVLMQTDRWQTSMGDKLQSKIETFTSTIDKAQKVFDLAMPLFDDTDNGEEAMLHDTFLLFDASNNGRVTVADLHSVAKLYSISALSGSKAEELMLRYDLDEDRALNRAEYKELVGDASLPSVMSVVLRSYASSLLNIAGSVGGAKTRSEVAAAVADYLQLVCSKNMTKVSWVAGALTNGSLPIAFTADVLAQLSGNPDHADTGAVLVGQMVNYGPDRVADAVELMANATFWQASGFDVEGQMDAVEIAARWATEGIDSPALPALLQLFGASAADCSALTIDEESELSHLFQAELELVHGLSRDRSEDEQSLLQQGAAMLRSSLGTEQAASSQTEQALGVPALARQFAERSKLHRAVLLKAERALHSDVSLSPARARSALRRILGDENFPQFLSSVIVADPNVAQVVNQGVPARPETLQFAEWLSNNATATARQLAQQCFRYTSQSSGTLESVASRVGGMVKSMQAATSALATLASAHKKGNIEGAFFNVSNALLASIEENRQLAPQLSEESLRAVARAVAALLEVASNSTTPEAEAARAMSQDLLLRARSPVFSSRAEHDSLWPEHGSAVLFESAWDKVVPFVSAMQDSIPSNVIGIRFSRGEVISTSHGLKTLFSVFQESGPQVFDNAAARYRSTWTKYIVIDFLVAFWFAFFALWASGFFGTHGHAAHPSVASWVNRGEEDEEEPSPPTNCVQKAKMTCAGIYYGFMKSADNYMLFWSVLLMTEIALLLFFMATMAISLFYAVRLLLASGCGELYILGSRAVCQETLLMVSEWMSTFTHVGGAPIDSACDSQNLLTCDVITSSLGRALTFTLFASFLAATLSWLVLVDSAAANETIRWRLAELEDEAGEGKGEKSNEDEEK